MLGERHFFMKDTLHRYRAYFHQDTANIANLYPTLAIPVLIKKVTFTAQCS